MGNTPNFTLPYEDQAEPLTRDWPGSLASKAGEQSFASDLDTKLNNLLPWRHEISPLSTPILQTGSFADLPTTLQMSGFVRYNISSAQNDEVGWDIVLSAGTWKAELACVTGTAYPILTLRLDGVDTSATFDLYAASGPNWNVAKTATGIVIATPGKKRLSLKAATKNASSSGYQFLFSQLTLQRTA